MLQRAVQSAGKQPLLPRAQPNPPLHALPRTTESGRLVIGYGVFPWKHPRRAVVYHLVYHWTLKLHVNHLMLLHAYQFSVMLMVSAVGGEICAIVIFCLFALVEILVARSLFGISHVLCLLGPLGLLAYWTSLALEEPVAVVCSSKGGVCTKLFIAACGFAAAIISLLLQLAGHALWEEYQAPASPLHGLVTAPVLEWVSLWLRVTGDRCPGLPSHLKEIWQESAEIRRKTRRNNMRIQLLARYDFQSEAARRRWTTERPCRLLDRSLGRPILVCDDDGKYIEPTDEQVEDMLGCNRRSNVSGLCRASQQLLNDASLDGAIQLLLLGWTTRLKIDSGVSGNGVFCLDSHSPGDYIGPYQGTVMTEEEYEARNDGDEDSCCSHDFTFSINEGSNAVVLDGASGVTVNELKYLNHSCSPNVEMREVFICGCWHVLVFAIQEIKAGSELCHDYHLSTENPEDPNLEIKCTCGSSDCRESLYQLYEW